MKAAVIGQTKGWLIFALIFVALTVSVQWLGGHTDQRLGLLSIGAAAVVFLWFSRPLSAPRLMDCPSLLVCSLVLLAGLISSLLAHQPLWAFAEIALVVVCCCCAEAFARTRRSGDVSLDQWLMLFVIFLCAFKGFEFLVQTFRLFSYAPEILDTDRLLTGFSNKRFYGQFQTFTLPLLALPLLLTTTKRSTQAWIFSLLSLWWLIAIVGGTRGTWLGMGVAASVMLICGRSGRRWLVWQLFSAVTGLLFFWLLFSVLPAYLGLDVRNFAGDRLTTTLSAREVIWQQAWDMIQARPWLGYGPMHFADIHNPVASHPHQAILQWASEWGVPSALLVIAIVGWGMWATLRLIRERAVSNDPVDLLRICLFASLIGALTQSMVDGVIVMPNSQFWLALVVGWLMGIHVWRSEPPQPNAFIRRTWAGISIVAVLFLVYIVIRDVPHLDERNTLYQQQYGGHFQPRFWTQGVIAIKPE